MGNRKFRVYRLQIDTNNTPGQALQFMQRFVRRDIGRQPLNMRVFTVKHINQQDIRTLRCGKLGIGDIVQQWLSDGDRFADHYPTFAGANGIQQLLFIHRYKIGGTAVQQAFSFHRDMPRC